MTHYALARKLTFFHRLGLEDCFLINVVCCMQPIMATTRWVITCSLVRGSYLSRRFSSADTSAAVQATTISTAGVNDPFAFFVEASSMGVNQSVSGGNVTVELYRHHEGQNPELSLYKPDYVFRMNLAEGSNNLGARYWHVFNLVHNSDTGEYEVQEANRDGQVITTDNATQYTSHNGSIETDYVDVLCNVPEQDCR